MVNVFVRSVVDAWGKIPLGNLNGTFYELGEFSQCFHIEPIKTQYCLVKLKTESKYVDHFIYGKIHSFA